jgi:hypothetical protein
VATAAEERLKHQAQSAHVVRGGDCRTIAIYELGQLLQSVQKIALAAIIDQAHNSN